MEGCTWAQVGVAGRTHIIGNGELVSAGRRAGVQTWAQREDRVRRGKAGGRLLPPCGHLTPLPTRSQAGRAGEHPGQGLSSWGLGPVSSGSQLPPLS